MCNREHLKEEIKKFIENDKEKVMLITGTNQYKKCIELLKTLNEHLDNGEKVLFRVDSKDSIEQFLNNIVKGYDLNKLFKVGNLKLCFDTMDFETWKNNKYKVSILYPIDIACEMSEMNQNELVSNLVRNTTDKVFLVSNTDYYDYTWLISLI